MSFKLLLLEFERVVDVGLLSKDPHLFVLACQALYVSVELLLVFYLNDFLVVEDAIFLLGAVVSVDLPIPFEVLLVSPDLASLLLHLS